MAPGKVRKIGFLVCSGSGSGSSSGRSSRGDQFLYRFGMELLQVTAVWFRKVQCRCSETCVGSSEAASRMLRLRAHGKPSEAYLIVTYGLICVLAILASHSGSSMFDVLILHAHKIHQVQCSLSDCENGIGPWQDRICQ